MPSVHFPYDESGTKAARRAVGLHPAARLVADKSYDKPKPKKAGRPKPKRSDEVPSGNRYA